LFKCDLIGVLIVSQYLYYYFKSWIKY